MIIDLQPHCGYRELYFVGELTSKIIKGMTTDGEIILRTKEGKDPYQNGLIKLLDEMCKFWKWDKGSIVLEIHDPTLTHPEYPVYYTLHNRDMSFFSEPHMPLPWSGEKYYGMFIGRANASRLRAIHNHSTFKYKDFGLTSFQDNISWYVDPTEALEYLAYSGQTYQEMISIKPYSDIDKLRTPPICPPYNMDRNLWRNVYKKIAVDIVCETAMTANSMATTEKVYRASYYKRPFILIGAKHMLKNLRDMFGVKIFSDVIPDDYDELENMQRVDRVFEILNDLIESGRINTLLDDCKDDIEENYCTMLRMGTDAVQTAEKFQRYWATEHWHRKPE